MFDNLPPPLIISRSLCNESALSTTKSTPNAIGNNKNLAVMQWAQFVAHDLSKPVVTSMGKCANCLFGNLTPVNKFNPIIYVYK